MEKLPKIEKHPQYWKKMSSIILKHVKRPKHAARHTNNNQTVNMVSAVEKILKIYERNQGNAATALE